MDKLNSLHKLLLECLEDDEIDAMAKAQLTLAQFHTNKAIKEQSIIEFIKSKEDSNNELDS